MKRITLLLVVLNLLLCTYAQSWQSGVQKLYTYPDTTRVGIGISAPTERLHVYNGALKIGNTTSSTDRTNCLLKFGDGSYVQMGEWEADDLLSFKATRYNFTNGNVGIGVTDPQYKLDVNGKIYLHPVDWVDNWGCSYLQWQCHKLIMGVPVNRYAHTMVEIVPGGSSEGELFSSLSLYHAYSSSQKVEKIRFTSHEHSWINSAGNFGIGTNNPLYKLDVRGTIRANEIIVNNISGADFVFDESYNLRSLSEVKEFVQKNQHLPEIPSADEMKQNGVNMNELQIQLLQKVEELTLYIIQQEQRIQELELLLFK